MYSVRPNLLIRKLYPSAIWRITANYKKKGNLPNSKEIHNIRSTGKRGGVIYLTFDDGPIPKITPWVLSLLKKYKAKATFFCVGANIEKHPEILQQIISEGHSVGNHTYNHLNGWETTTKEYLESVEKFEKSLQSAAYSLKLNNTHIQKTVDSKPLFRPPYGKIKPSQFSRLRSQYSIIMWDVLSGDFDQTISKEKCLKNVVTKTREGSIVVFHDSLKAEKNLVFVLPKFLEHFSKEGYEFSPNPSPSERG